MSVDLNLELPNDGFSKSRYMWKAVISDKKKFRITARVFLLLTQNKLYPN